MGRHKLFDFILVLNESISELLEKFQNCIKDYIHEAQKISIKIIMLINTSSEWIFNM
jgi:hypothetical protein